MKKLIILTAFFGFANCAWAQYYYNDGGYSESLASQNAEQENYNRLQSQAQEIYQQQQQQQMQEQLNRQQQEINSFNNASPIDRFTGNY